MSRVEDFQPIGTYGNDIYFNGVFDGQGHTICNVNMTAEKQGDYNGLFGTLAGTVCNLTLENSSFEGLVCGAFCSTSLSGEAKLYNCIARNVSVDADTTGILAGEFEGKTNNCLIDGYECRELNDMEGWLVQYADMAAYNERLDEMSAECHNIPMHMWTSSCTLEPEIGIKTSEMYITIDSYSYNGKILPVYLNGNYYFFMPGKDIEGTVILHVPEDSQEKYEIVAPSEGIYEQAIPLQDGLFSVIICYNEHVPSVFVDCNRTWSLDYLKSAKTNIIYGGNVQVLDEHGVADYKGGMESIHTRGNDSWLMPKKGFTINFIEDSDLLGMGADKEYALLPGYRDSSLLTYKVVQDLTKEMQLDFAPEYEFVNLYIDGEYQGLYILAEKMNVGYHRINIDSSNKDISGGYLYEFDNCDYMGEEHLFTTNKGNTYVIRDPYTVNDLQVTYSLELWNQYEEAIYSSTGYNAAGHHYSEYMDRDSLAKLWLFLQINGEYSVNSSLYFYKDSDSRGDGKIHALYPWDVEHSLLVEDFIEENVMLNMNGEVAGGLWTAIYQHPDMQEAIYQNWVELFRPALCKLLDEETDYQKNGLSYIGTYGEYYKISSGWNELLWGKNQSIADKGEFIEYYLQGRIPYLDEILKPTGK